MLKQVDVFYNGWGACWRWGSLRATTAVNGRELVAFEYSEQALSQGLELSAYTLPLKGPRLRMGFPAHQWGLPGPVYDALPDGWGMLLMDRFFKRKGLSPARMGVLERLAYIGSTAMGAMSFEPVTVQTVVNYVAIVDVDNADLKLRPGMTANASVVTAKRENVLRLPNAALRFRPPDGVAVAPPEHGEQAAPAAGGERPAGTEGRSDDREDRSSHGEWRRDHGGGTGAWGGGEGGSHVRQNGENGGDANRKMVYVPDGKGGLRMQPVELGISDGTWTEIIGAHPQEGDWVVTGIQSASDKETVKAGSSSPFMPRPPGGGPR